MLLIRFDPVFLADLSQPDYCQKTEGKPQVSTVSIKNITLCCSYFLFSPEASMSLFLSGIVVVQLASHVPRTALNIYELCMVSKRENLSNIYIRIFQTISSSSIPLSSSWLVDLSHLLLAISSSSNVIIFSVQVNNNPQNYPQNCHLIYKTLIVFTKHWRFPQNSYLIHTAMFYSKSKQCCFNPSQLQLNID